MPEDESVEPDDIDDADEAADEQAEALDLSADDRKLVTQPYDLGVKSLSHDIEQGRLSLTIEYQRRYVWDAAKASRLIESLLLNVPIPVCYFAEDQDGNYEVIDGLQRLTAIKNFLENKVPLTGLSVLSELDGKRFSDLAPRDRRRLENRTIRCIVITEDSNPDIKFDVFERLNTGAAMLTAQELRNSVYRGTFNDELKTLIEDPDFVTLVGSSKSRRMEFEELILRFFALVEGIDGYKPPLRQFLNLYMRTHRQQTPDTSRVGLFRSTCAVVHEVFGETPFRPPGAKNSLNKAVFDAFMIPVAFARHDELREKAEAVRTSVPTIYEDSEFLTAIGRATADRHRMLYRIGRVSKLLKDAGVKVDLADGLGLEDSPSKAQ